MQSAYSFICGADLEEAKLVFILGVAWGFLYVSLMEGEREREREPTDFFRWCLALFQAMDLLSGVGIGEIMAPPFVNAPSTCLPINYL